MTKKLTPKIKISDSESEEDDEFQLAVVPKHRGRSKRAVSTISESSGTENDCIIIKDSQPSSFLGSSPSSGNNRSNNGRKRVLRSNEQVERNSRRSKAKLALELLRKKRRKPGEQQSDSDTSCSYDDGDGFIASSSGEEEIADEDEFLARDIHDWPVKPKRNPKNVVYLGRSAATVEDSSDEEEGIAGVSGNNAEIPEEEDDDDDSLFEDDIVKSRGGTRNCDDWKSELPEEFSMATNLPLSESFAVFIQLLASEALSPGFIETCIDERDSYFLSSLGRINNLVETKKRAVVTSHIWKVEFKNDLENFPQLSTREYVMLQDALCDACRRKGRVARFEMKLYGKTYNHETLQSSSTSASSSTKPKTVRYLMGCFCMSRSELYHRMHHYKYNLLKRVREEMAILKTQCGHLDDQRLLLKFMEDSRLINRWFHEFKEMDRQMSNFTID